MLSGRWVYRVFAIKNRRKRNEQNVSAAIKGQISDARNSHDDKAV